MGLDKRANLPVRTASIVLSDTTNHLFRLKANDIKKGSGETPQSYRTIAVDANGSDDSKLIVFINIGSSSTVYDQYQFSAYATGVADPNAGVAATVTHTQCTTLGALIAAINAYGPEARKHTSTDPLGLYARRLHAPADYSLDTDDFIDLTEINIPEVFTDYLLKDASEVLTMAYRLGVPDDIKGYVGAGLLEFIAARAYVNSNSATDCVFKISEDPSETDATQEVELGYTRYVPDGAWTDLFDYATGMPPVLRGPILIELTSTTTMTETTSKCLINYRSAEE